MPTKDVSAAEEVVRAVSSDASQYSKQPRFHEDAESAFGGIYLWRNRAELEAPEYRVDSRERDTWLGGFWKIEPHWAGVLNAVVLLDANRGWELVGSKRQVNRYAAILRHADGEGWRSFMKRCALSYRTADIGTVVEIGREGERGPMRGLFHVDPTRCRLTGQIRAPLKYYPGGRVQEWKSGDYFRAVSMPSVEEAYRGLGYCATSRAIELVKLLYAVLQHDLERAGAKMPEGLLLLQGISKIQWQQSLTSRKEELTANMRRYFGGLMVLAGSGVEQVAAKLIALSELPANFDRKTFLDLTMYAYALVEGRDPSEFWPVQFGVLGRGDEGQSQHLKAASKGGLDYVLSMQEKIQNEMPDSLYFSFLQRDDRGLLLEAEVSSAWAEVAFKLGSAPGAVDPILDKEQVMSLLADHGIIPKEWTAIEEDTRVTDIRRWLAVGGACAEVRCAAEVFPSEQIVRYAWPSGRLEVLWERGSDLLVRKSWPSALPGAKLVKAFLEGTDLCETREGEGEVLYQSGDITISEDDVVMAFRDASSRQGQEIGALLTAQAETDTRSLISRLLRKAK